MSFSITGFLRRNAPDQAVRYFNKLALTIQLAFQVLASSAHPAFEHNQDLRTDATPGRGFSALRPYKWWFNGKFA